VHLGSDRAKQFPELRSLSEDPHGFAVYVCEISGIRCVFPCNDGARTNPSFQFNFDKDESSLVENPSYSGEIRLIPQGSFFLLPSDQRKVHPNWLGDFTVKVWPKSEISMIDRSWASEADMATSVLSHYDYYERPDHNERGYHRPRSAADMDYVVINSRRWCISICGYYKDSVLLIAEITEHLIVKIVFHTSSCWPRDTQLPEGLKEHLMPFFLDYLSLIQIVPTEGVSESELPPLGFYPSKREEKEIDSEGKEVIDTPPSDSSNELSW
jgi:hypothetical protein